MKNMKDSYLYRTTDYGKEIYNYLMEAKRIDKQSDAFADIIYEVKMRQVSPVILKVLLSNKVVLLLHTKGMSRAFKVLYAHDVKSPSRNRNDKDMKVYIDCTNLIKDNNGKYTCKHIPTLISYIITAMAYVLYHKIPKTILTDSVLVKAGAEAFVDMMLYILGYLKVPVTYNDNKERMTFSLVEYFLYCILGKDSEESNIALATKISGIKQRRTADYLHTVFADTINNGEADIKTYFDKFVDVFLGVDYKHKELMTIDSIVSRWMYSFGPGTYLGLELFVPFSAILTDCYVGDYINMQNTIEKIVGKNVVLFTNELLKIGSENA